MRHSTPHGPFARMPGRFLLELAACLWLGAVATAIVLPAMAVLLALPMELKWLTASSLFFAAFAVVTIWLLRARTVASEKRGYSGTRPSFTRGVLTLELVGGFPLIGWFVAFPIGFVVALGASMFAMLRWTPREPITAVPRAPG